VLAALRALVASELSSQIAYTPFLARREVGRLLVADDFVGRPRTIENLLELIERRRANGTARTA
jgi:hypothetical protein